MLEYGAFTMNNDETLIKEIKEKERTIQLMIQNHTDLLDEYLQMRDIMMVFYEHMKYLPIHHQEMIKQRLREIKYNPRKRV